MELQSILSPEIPVATFELILRLAVSFVLSGAIGAEREFNNQPAGLRTHILIGVGASILMILSLSVPFEEGDGTYGGGDPGRIAAQVVSGIGFLGGGAILRLGGDIRGLTTAASIWIVAALGLSIGAGLYLVAGIGTVFTLGTLFVLGRVEKRYVPKRILKQLSVHARTESLESSDVQSILDDFGISVRTVAIQRSREKRSTQLRYTIYVPPDVDYDEFYRRIYKLEDIYKIVVDDL
ncbi:MAG: MgtC/SapB family protein [Spirochaetales bacterium]